jgi:hypothetical protein
MNLPIPKLREQIQSQNKIITDLRSENNKLKLEINFLTLANEDLQKFNDKNNTVNCTMSSSLNDYKDQVEKLNTNISLLKEQLSEKTNKPLISRLRQKIIELNVENEHKNNIISDLKSSIYKNNSTSLATKEVYNISSTAQSEEKVNTITLPTDVDQIKLDLDNVNGILLETQQQLHHIELSNIKLQEEVKVKSTPHKLSQLPPRGKIQEEIKRLKNIINNKNSIINTNIKKINDLINVVPRIIVHIDGMDPKELYHIPLRKKVFELVKTANSNVNKDDKSKIHVHLQDDTIIDINDENIKNKLEEMIKHNNHTGHNCKSAIHVHINDESEVELNDKELKNKIEELINNSKDILNKSKTNIDPIHVHLHDDSIIKIDDHTIKNKLEKLILNSESIVYNAKNTVHNLELSTIPSGNLYLYNNHNYDNDED